MADNEKAINKFNYIEGETNLFHELKTAGSDTIIEYLVPIIPKLEEDSIEPASTEMLEDLTNFIDIRRDRYDTLDVDDPDNPIMYGMFLGVVSYYESKIGRFFMDSTHNSVSLNYLTDVAAHTLHKIFKMLHYVTLTEYGTICMIFMCALRKYQTLYKDVWTGIFKDIVDIIKREYLKGAEDSLMFIPE